MGSKLSSFKTAVCYVVSLRSELVKKTFDMQLLEIRGSFNSLKRQIGLEEKLLLGQVWHLNEFKLESL